MKTFLAFALLWLAPATLAQSAITAIPLAPGLTNAAAKARALVTAGQNQSAPPAAQGAQAKATPAVDPAKEDLIRKLFEVQGTRKTMEEVIAGLSGNMRPMLAQSLPPGDYRDTLIDLFFKKFQAKMKIDDLIDLIVPIYDRHFSKEDIAGLMQFYQTPLGKKLNSVASQLAIETQTAASKMGEELGRQSMLEVLAEHPEIAKALEDAGAGPKN